MSTQPLIGRSALVTASSRYTGAFIARAMARAGARIAIHYFGSKDKAEALAAQLTDEGCEVATFGADGRNAADLRRMAAEIKQQWGGVDILVNNLGPYSDVPFLELPEEQWDWIMNTNLKAPYVLAQEFGPGMIERGWGRVINISAASAFSYTHSIYGLSKAALLHLTAVLAGELAPHVTVNALAPGQIEDSELIDTIDPNYKRTLREQSPLKKLVTRQQIADVILALCGDMFETTTGQTIRMDAGWSIRSTSYDVGAVEFEEGE